MKSLKKFFTLLLCVVVCIALVSCGNPKTKEVEILNFTKPVAGEEIVVINVRDYGQIKIKLFPEIAPNAVENFKALINNGYYTETIIYYSKFDECIAMGDPKGNGTGGVAANGGYIDDELSPNLRNFTGAVGYFCDMDSNGDTIKDSNGSRFYIINTEKNNGLTDKFFDFIKDYGYEFPDNVKKKYQEVGGSPMFDGGFTVFGQVIEGMDIIYKINNAEVDKNYKPKDQIKIDTIEIEKYE